MMNTFNQRWKRIDSLLEKGLNTSAQKEVEQVLKQARTEQNTEEYIHALCVLRVTQNERDETSRLNDIKFFENELKQAQFPVKQLLHSMTAELYWTYYEENRWQIMNRTKGASAYSDEDIQTWSADVFYQKTYNHYQSSLAMNDEAKKYSLTKLQKILLAGEHTEKLRPTLYDFLIHRAFDFFRNDEIEITEPEYAFEIDDAKAFSAAATFCNARFKTSDTESPKYTALELLQDAIRFHLNDVDPSALIDVDLERIKYCYSKSTLDDKKELYKDALDNLAKRYPNNSLAAQASLLYAQTFVEDNRGYGDENAEQDASNYIMAVSICKQLVAKFPDATAGIEAKNLLASIYKHRLQVTTEKVVLPNQTNLAKINFRNVSKVYCRIARITHDQLIKLQQYFNYGEQEKSQFVLNLPTQKQWQVNLPKTEDYKQHSTEIAIDGLSLGTYVLIVSESNDFNDNSETNFTLMQVSNLAYIIPQKQYGQSNTFYVVHRNTGEPLGNVQVKTWLFNYDYETRKNAMTTAGTYTSDKNGKVLISAKNQNVIPEIIQGEDHLLLFDNLYDGEMNEQYPEQTRAFLFTDRSIYRPNQTVYFKAILIRSKGKGYKQHELLQNKLTKVKFFDANYQLIKEQNFTSNEFGSIHGSFVAPEGLLTGQFSIQCESDQTYFSVEEYKRPKFEVAFDTIKSSYRLNDEIHVIGKAKAYAGNAIDGAVVKYTVTRRARFPYWWCYYRGGQQQSNEMAIAHGKCNTKSDGSFEFTFIAKPDATVSKESKPTFDYEVHADITDINGETRSGTQQISVAYESLLVSIHSKDEVEKDTWKTLQVKTKNLSGAHVTATVSLSLKKLKSPDQIYRSRLWSKVDMPLWEKEEFHKQFPFDEFGDETNKLNWETEKTIWTKNVQSTEEGNIQVTAPAEDGWYVVEAKTTDVFGMEVIEKKFIRFFQVNDFSCLNSEMLRTHVSKETFEPGETANLKMASPYEEVSLLYMSSYQTNDTKNNLQWISLKDQKQIEYPITENERGGFFSHYMYVKQNRMYTGQASIAVPWTNKELVISTETFRDKMLPGSEQEWTLKITGSKKEKVSAEVLATMYDASLDAFRSHAWNRLGLYATNSSSMRFESGNNFTSNAATPLFTSQEVISAIPDKRYDELNWWQLKYQTVMLFDRSISFSANAEPQVKFTPPVVRKAEMASASEKPPVVAADSYTWSADSTSNTKGGSYALKANDNSKNEATTPALRTNFNETAFFYPQLHTDEQGNILLKFKAPESLTRWKLMAFAHTASLQEGMLSENSVTQKEVMMVPNTPRFLREGDHMLYSAKVSNLSAQTLKGNAVLQIIDALTNNPVDLLFENATNSIPLSVAALESSPVQWKIHIPEGFTHPVLVKTYFQSNQVSDGEQNTLPVLLNSMLVTETLPLSVKANEHKAYRFEKLLNSEQSKTIRHYNLSVEYTTNPAWYAVQALPYLTDFPHACAEQTFNRYYANALATFLANSNPKIKTIFSDWQEKDSSALLSNLEKNQELKAALLEETPWVLDAKNEQEQKKNLKVLFDVTRMSKELERTTRELALMQSPNGGFSWFKGMPDDRFVTQYILSGMGRLKHLGVKEMGSNQRVQSIIAKAIPYLDARLAEDYNELLKTKAKLSEQQISYFQLQWLYMRSFFLTDYPIQEQTRTAFKFYKEQCAKYWVKQNKYMQALSAISLHRMGDEITPKAIIASLRENAIHKEAMGMYWKEINSSYWWYEAPVESMSMLIECFREVAMSEAEVDEMKIWLLKNKQTTNWKTTKATADACYALLLNGTYWLASEPQVAINLGGKAVSFSNKEGGTGYVKTSFEGKEILPSMGNIDVDVKGGKGITWGAVYWQYFEQLDKISSSQTPLQLKKTMYKVEHTAQGDQLVPITSQSPLHIGDKVSVKIELRVDRVMEYIHLKDMRASCFEPLNVLSSYRYQNGLGYYEATKDMATHFFFSWLPTGTYVFEYPMFVTHEGSFSNGIAQAQCMYAPEFSSHSEGLMVEVKK